MAHTAGESRSVARKATGTRVYQLRVTLREVSPLVWRRLLVPIATTIAQLHDILQIALGWEDVHLQQFVIHGKSYGVYHYEYDFGDGWKHDIRLEQVLPLDARHAYPVCTAGHGACPPEDCGGPAGYTAFLQEHRPWAPSEDVDEATDLLVGRALKRRG